MTSISKISGISKLLQILEKGNTSAYYVAMGTWYTEEGINALLSEVEEAACNLGFKGVSLEGDQVVRNNEMAINTDCDKDETVVTCLRKRYPVLRVNFESDDDEIPEPELLAVISSIEEAGYIVDQIDDTHAYIYPMTVSELIEFA